MTRGRRAQLAKEKYDEFFDELVLNHLQAHQILPKLQDRIPVSDLTAFRDAFYLRARIIGTERDKYWAVAGAIYNQLVVPLSL
jgi:hypothetical protein